MTDDRRLSSRDEWTHRGNYPRAWLAILGYLTVNPKGWRGCATPMNAGATRRDSRERPAFLMREQLASWPAWTQGVLTGIGWVLLLQGDNLSGLWPLIATIPIAIARWRFRLI